MMNANYDSTVYSVTVYVLNSEKAEDVMTITVVLKNETTGEKVNEVVFKNTYHDPYNPKTGDSSNIALYAALCGLSAVAVVTVVLVGRKRKTKTDNS